MTKDEILFKISGVKNIHHTVYNASEVEMAMNEWGKQVAKGFAEWAFGDEINPFVKHGDRYIQACGNSTSWSIEQLFHLYNKQVLKEAGLKQD